MFQDEYQKVELPAIEQLTALGWEYVEGSKLSPDSSTERKNYKEVILEDRLAAAIKRINPWINEENLHRVVRGIAFPQLPTLMEMNRNIWGTLTSPPSIDQDLGKGRRGQTVSIIDFKNPQNNEYLCVNQFKIAGPKQNIIPDILLFINGIPLVVIECKSPYITNPMESGLNQLLRYANRRNPHEDEGAERLFHYNQLMISTYRDSAKVGTISSGGEHYLEWKDPYPLDAATLGDNPTSQQLMIAGMLTPKNLLDIIQNFTVYETVEGKVIKKIARYQQFRAVHKAIERIKTGKTKRERGGIIWHTQGSGKSLTMVFLAIKMRRDDDLKKYKLVFITDRKQLDKQLSDTFEAAQGETVYRAKSITEFKELLAKDSSDLVTGMMQKLAVDADDIGVLNESSNIIVMTDEAHRSQYGGLGVALNSALPNAPKIAFTGTPLISSEKTTHEFGTYIDRYTIEQAVKDGATVQILYEGREAKTKVTGDSLDKLFDIYFADKTEEQKAEIKKKFGTEAAVLEAPQRIRWICIDILGHYRSHIAPNGFKAMIVTNSRKAAITYKQEMDKLGGPEVEVIISGNHNDPSQYHPHTDSTRQKKQIENFKKPVAEHPLSVIVVKDMLLTGFDAPICQVMYLDRKLQEHTLLQAIARVNRTYKGKSRGFIVDYYGLSDYLTEALRMFSNDDVAGAMKELKDEIPKLKAAHTRVMKYFDGADTTDIDECVLLLKAAEKRQQFEIDFKKFAKQMDIVMPSEAAKPYMGDLAKLGKINHGARNMYREKGLDLTGVGEKVRQLIDEHIHATGVDPKIPPVDLLAGDFAKQMEQHKSPRARASDIEYAIRHHIDVHIEEDQEYYKKLSERLEDLLRQKEGHWDELVQLLMEFREDVETAHERDAKALGLTDVEFAFYNIIMAEVELSDEVDSKADGTKAEAIELTKQMVDMMDEATEIVDFFQKDDEIKKMKQAIKRTVMDASFDSERLRSAVMERFMELARVRFKQ